MDDDPPFEVPQIADEDIRWASAILGLKPNAFFGKDGNDPRQDALKSMQTTDFAACPGSGKTTLLVTKLVILVEKWSWHTRGICVLSHTNGARHEVQNRLGNTAVGQRLLSYPHFIGTIHAFADEFLAIPWLRSMGYPVKMIDSEICQNRRWNALPRATRQALEKNGHGPSLLLVKSPDFGIGSVAWGKKPKGKKARSPLDTSTMTYRNIRDVCQRSTAEGYFCYDEMFVWAKDLIERLPSIVSTIRDRFPLLFIDEAQDNSEEQSIILHRIFMEGDNAVKRQRFGDENQAIFNSVGAKGATSHRFPEGSILALPNSHRFGEKTARLADPLGICPYGMTGQGPKTPLASGKTEGQHTIFLFDEGSVDKVFDAYADLLIDTFSQRELRDGTFLVVAHRHRPPDASEGYKFPHCIRDYWPEYDPELANQDPKPSTFVQYALAGMAKAKRTGEAHGAVQKIAEGVLRLASAGQARPDIFRRRDCHQHVLRLLEKNPSARAWYALLVSRFAARQKPLTRNTWEGLWRDIVQGIGEALAEAPLSCAEAHEFLSWKDDAAPVMPYCDTAPWRDNVYHYSRDGKTVAIRVGSIHSVKGETHSATLILETYWKGRNGRHNMELLLPWLQATSCGAEREGPDQKTRLKTHYVAMTRPAYLLCLAMKKSSLHGDDPSATNDARAKLNAHGWHISDLTVGNSGRGPGVGLT